MRPRRAARRTAKAHDNFGFLLAALGRAAEVILHFDAAVALAPDFRDAAQNLDRSRDPIAACRRDR